MYQCNIATYITRLYREIICKEVMGIKQGINKISFTLVLAQAMYEDLATDATLSVKCNIAI